MSRPTLLVLTSTYPRWVGDHEPGFVHELCRRLVDRFNVIVLTSSAPGAASTEVMDGVEVVRYRYAPRKLETLVYGGGIATHLKRSPWKLLLVPSFILGQYLTARRLVRRRRIDLVHAHWLIPQGWIASRLASQSGGIPFLVTSHGADLYGFRAAWLTRVKRNVAARAAAMTVVSGAMREAAQQLGLTPRRFVVLPMGADMLGRFTPDASVHRSTNELLFVGRLVAKKGLPHLIDAMPHVLRERPDARLTIAGFGPEQAELEARAARLGLVGRVQFLGSVTQADLPALYQRAAILVAPFIREADGNQEGLPVVLMEAAACGCPIIAGRVDGVAELFGPAADAVCVDPTDTDALATAILRALDEPEAVRARALQVRQRLLGWLDWTVVSTAYADLLAACMEPATLDRT